MLFRSSKSTRIFFQFMFIFLIVAIPSLLISNFLYNPVLSLNQSSTEPTIDPRDSDLVNPTPITVPILDIPGVAQDYGTDTLVTAEWFETGFGKLHTSLSGFSLPLGPGILRNYTCNMTVSNFENKTISVEDSTAFVDGQTNMNEEWFMSFQIPRSLRLGGVSIYVTLIDRTVLYRIYNATFSGGQYYPHQPITASFSSPDESYDTSDQWYNLTFPGIPLNSSITQGDYFFLSIIENTPRHWGWNYVDDAMHGGEPDEGYVYYYYSGYNEEDWDLFLKIITQTPSDNPLPSEVQLTVNGTAVDDVAPGLGRISEIPNLPLSTRKDVSFKVSAFWPLVYSINVTAMTERNFVVSTEFQVLSTSNITTWNYSNTIDFPTSSALRRLEYLLPSDYIPQNITVNGVNHTQWQLNATSHVFEVTNANNGTWVLISEAPNYLTNIETRSAPAGPTIDNSYIDQIVYGFGSVRDSLGTQITSGIGNLVVFDPTLNVNSTGTGAPDGNGNVIISWDILTTATENGSYILQLLWQNGTEAGLNNTILFVNWAPSNLTILSQPDFSSSILIGSDLQFTFNHTEFPSGNPLEATTINVINRTSGMPWDSFTVYNRNATGEPGIYDLTVFTHSAQLSAMNNVTVMISEFPYQPFSFEFNFTLAGETTSLIPIDGTGITFNAIRARWELNPNPYINDTSKEFQVEFLDESSAPIKFATVSAILYYSPTYNVTLPVFELESTEGGAPGVYEIEITTLPIRDHSFSSGENLTITLVAWRSGYASSPEITVHLQILPRVATFSVLPLTQDYYSDWVYSTAFRVLLQDAETGKGLDQAQVSFSSPGFGIGELSLIANGTGLFEVRDFNTNVTAGNHTFEISAVLTNFAINQLNLTLEVFQRQNIQAVLMNPSNNLLMLGDQTVLNIKITTEDGSPIAENTPVEVRIQPRTSGDTATQNLLADAQGVIRVRVELSSPGLIDIFVSVPGTEEIS
ncbi:MAG: hypothetical protein ACXACA_02535, partial [Candidatus Ranarchaeia archaeon]